MFGVTALRDGHTSVLGSQPLIQAIYRQPGRSLPLGIAIIDGRLFVRRNYLGAKGPPEGGEIVAVNDRPAADFLADCRRMVASDGALVLRADRYVERDSSSPARWPPVCRPRTGSACAHLRANCVTIA